MALVGWIDTGDGTSTGDLLTYWPDAPDDDEAEVVLQAAYEDAVDWLPAAKFAAWEEAKAADPALEPSVRWKIAQGLFAHHIWARKRAGNGDTYGGPDGGFAVSTWPLVLEARQKLRPKKGPSAIL